jgi:hypothetical protein
VWTNEQFTVISWQRYKTLGQQHGDLTWESAEWGSRGRSSREFVRENDAPLLRVAGAPQWGGVDVPKLEAVLINILVG